MSAINGKGGGESSAATTFKTEPLRKYLPPCWSQRSDPGSVSESSSCSCLSPCLLLHQLTSTCAASCLSSSICLQRVSCAFSVLISCVASGPTSQQRFPCASRLASS